MRFAKYHGLGNDFILVDRAELAADGDLFSEIAVFACDRHRGIGADGLILGSTEDELPRMEVYNADGSRPQMCGNGLRCFVAWWSSRSPEPVERLRVVTDAGLLSCQRFGDGTVEVDMGRAEFEPGRLPMHATSSATTLRAGTVEVRGQAVSTGNPHFVIRSDRPWEDARRLGGLLTSHQTFPEGVNVEFVRILDDHSLELVVWERGCGITQACGTGACATVAALAHEDPHWSSRDIQVRLPGGCLTVSVEPGGQMRMRGPAVHVYDGTLAHLLPPSDP